MKKTNYELYAFDLDGTLAESKLPISPQMTHLLGELLLHKKVAVISGGKYELLMYQVVEQLKLHATDTFVSFDNLFLLPVSGTRLYYWQNGEQKLLYQEDLSPAEKMLATNALLRAARELNLLEPHHKGALIEDRGGQISFSALGQNASIEDKQNWDRNGEKRAAIARRAAQYLPQLEVRKGGATTVDVTRIGIDKRFGISNILHHLALSTDQVFYVGDKMQIGGNDYPVVAMGVDHLEVHSPDDTIKFLLDITA